MSFKAPSVLLYLFFLHLAGIYLFTQGFLLSRLSLPTVTTCFPSDPCTLPPTHKRAVLLIIDALRFDFLSPNPPEPQSPYHHNILTLPRELTEKYPKNSFLFNAYSDPPTTTLQRIKGLVTGSLPTFVDMGHNFGGSSIDEDSIVKQLRMANKSVCVRSHNLSHFFTPCWSLCACISIFTPACLGSLHGRRHLALRLPRFLPP